MAELLQLISVLGIKRPKITTVSAHKLPVVFRLLNFIFTREANQMFEVDTHSRSSMWWDVP
jgi:2-dehydropantoate 2-reductase